MIQWYPGHMEKAKKDILKNLKLVDIVFELLDARLPLSSKNPMVDDILKNKPRLLLITKSSMADEKQNAAFLEYFRKQNQQVMFIDSFKSLAINKIAATARKILELKLEKEKSKGMKERAIRVMILGIPNVGKSTFINQLVSKRATNVGNKPGVTKSQQWIRLHAGMELLDTPGVLWPKFEDESVAMHLAISGAIKDQLLPLDEVVLYFLSFMQTYYPNNLVYRYRVIPSSTPLELLDQIGKNMNMLKNKEVDYDRVMHAILQDFRSLRLGRITLDRIAT